MEVRTSERRPADESALRSALWCGVVVLAVIGVAAAVWRVIALAGGGLSYEQVERLMPAESVREAYEFDRWFAARPALTLLHVVPGALLLALAPLQFSKRVRERHARLHRRAGRALVFAAVPAGLSGLLLAALFPLGGWTAAAAAFVAGAYFLFALTRAYAAIRRGDAARHREWMIRMFSVGLGIATIRVFGLALFAVPHMSFDRSAGVTFWAGWAATVAVAEYWIRRTRRSASVSM